MGAASNLHYVNGKDLYDVFGIVVESGQAGFDTPFPVKPSFKHNWPEENGADIDVSEPLKYETKEVSLECSFVISEGSDFKADFYTKKAAFEAEMSQPGYQTWQVIDHGKTYSVKYEGSKSGSKPFKRYTGSVGVVFSFTITLTVQPVLMPGNPTFGTVLLNGVFYGTVVPGATINVETLAGGVTPAITGFGTTIENGNTIVVSATAPAGYTLQYAFSTGIPERFLNFQTNNRFENLANGTYKVRARLLEAPNIYQTSGNIVINYTQPAPAESLTIDNVTTDGKQTIFITATKANTTRLIEYSFDNGSTWQSSNSKTVANGTYGPFQARLVGSNPAIVATWTATIVINYSAPVTTYNTILYPGQGFGPVTFQGVEGTEFHFNVPYPDANPFPASMTLVHNTSGAGEIGLVDFTVGGIGQPCAIKYNGVLYHIQGGFQNNAGVSVG